MNEDMSSIFHKPKFKQTLERYEEMRSCGHSAYFEADDLTLIAEYYAGIGDVKASEEVIDYALRLHPDNLDVQVFKCHNLIVEGETAKAQALLESLPDQTDYEVKLLQAELYLAQKHVQEADELLEGLYREEPETDVMLDIAQTYMNSMEKERAYEWLCKASRQSPGDLDTKEMLAAWNFSFGSTEEAARLYNQLLDEEPYNVELWQNLVRCHLRMDAPEKALEAAEFAIAIDDSDLLSWELKGNCLLMMKQTEEAFACFQHIEREAKDKGYIRNVMLNDYHFTQNDEKVLEYSDKLLADNQVEDAEWPSFYYKRAIAHLNLNQIGACKKDIRQGLAYDNHDSLLYTAKGEVHLYEGALEEAFAAFRQAKKYTDNPEETSETIACAFFRYEYMAEALQEFKRLEKLSLTRARNNYFFMAFCYYRLKMEKEMFSYLVRAAVYCPHSVIGNDLLSIPDEADHYFFNLSMAILHQVQDGRIDASRFEEKGTDEP